MQTIEMTPQELAAEILLIAEKGEHFNMAHWWYSTSATERLLFPAQKQELVCGTTLCIAGWAAHLTGWDLRSTAGGQGSVLAERPDLGIMRDIEKVAASALGISGGDAYSLFRADNEMAVAVLHQLAEGRPINWDTAYAESHANLNRVATRIASIVMERAGISIEIVMERAGISTEIVMERAGISTEPGEYVA